jgi:hypothetical protein
MLSPKMGALKKFVRSILMRTDRQRMLKQVYETPNQKKFFRNRMIMGLLWFLVCLLLGSFIKKNNFNRPGPTQKIVRQPSLFILKK